MKQNLYVPMMNGLFLKYRKEYMEKLTQIGDANPVICIERTFDKDTNFKNFDVLKNNLSFLSEHGYTPFVWAQAFGFGIPLDEKEAALSKSFERITDFDGNVLGDAMCPLGEDFLKYYEFLIQRIAKAGAKRIMLDDDLCLSVRPGLGCSCEKHLKMLSERLGKKVGRDILKKELFRGEGSELRRVWLDLMGETLIDFCKKVRSFADTVDPDIEMGFCAGYTSWDIEGVDAMTLTKVLAGKNKPFMRLTGAPYWVEQKRFDGQGMAQIVEFTRMQRAWCEGEGVEIFTENDSYPRPRYRVPAAILETFDFMIAADSDIGQLKYLFEYYSSPEYEAGYLSQHLRNRDKRNYVQSIMEKMPSKGIYVHEQMRKVETMAFPDRAPGNFDTMITAFSHAAELLSSCAIPTTYEKHDGVVIAFGDSGRTVDLNNHKGYIIDYPSALALMKRGVDVGIVSAKGAGVPFTEKFLRFDDQVLLDGCVRYSNQFGGDMFFDCEVQKDAQIESVYPSGEGDIIGSFRYENGSGQKFLVFPFDANAVKSNSGLSCSYYRQAQIIDACEWMGMKLPCTVRKHPGLYLIVKEDEKKKVIAFSNFSLDPAYDVLIETDTGMSVEGIGVEAKENENGVLVSCIQPWSTGCVVIRRS